MAFRGRDEVLESVDASADFQHRLYKWPCPRWSWSVYDRARHSTAQGGETNDECQNRQSGGPRAELVLFVSLVVPVQKRTGRRVPAMTKELCASGTT